MADSPDLPEIEILTPDRDDSDRAVSTSTTPSWRWLVAVGAALAAVAFLVVTGGDGAPADEETAGDRDGETASTLPGTSVPTTSGPITSGPITRPVTIEPGSGGPVLGRVFNASLLLGGAEEGWWLVDLTTNAVRRVPPLDGVPAQAIIPVRGGVAVFDPPARLPRLVRLPVGGETGTAIGATDFTPEADGVRLDGAVVGILGSGDPDALWILHAPLDGGSDPRLQASLVALDGQTHIGPFGVPGSPVAATESSIVLDAGGRSYAAGVDGVVDLGPGKTLDASGHTIARVVCDAELRCTEQIIDTRTGEATTGSFLPAGAVPDDRVTMVVSPQGGLVTVPGFRALDDRRIAPAVTPRVTRPGEEPVVVLLPSLRNEPAWIPDGESLVVLTNIGVHHLTIDQGLLAARRIEDLDIGDATDLLVVPGIDPDNPPRWRGIRPSSG